MKATLWIPLAALVMQVTAVEASLPANGSCSLFTFVPFSYGEEKSSDSYVCRECNNIGFSHAAAALMAIEHFNTRNTSVVKELSQFVDCPVQFDYTPLFDTASYTHLAAETLLEQPEPPCAVAGPFHDYPNLELSTLAASLKFPITAHRAFSIRALADYASPYTSQVFPDIITMAYVLADYLMYKGRTDFVAFVYSLTETGLHRRETVSILLDEYGIENQAFAYNSKLRSPATSDERSVEKALEHVVESGYRTIVVATELPTFEIPDLARVAVEKGLTNGDYMWVFFGDFDPFYGNHDPVIREFLAGSIFITPLEGYHLGEKDPFYIAWKSQGPKEVKRLNEANPMSPGQPGYFFAENDYFQNTTIPEWGSSFLYDAVMSTGIGACLAWETRNTTDDLIPVESFVKGIRSVNFTGATGVIQFCHPDYCELHGARDPNSTIWGILNNYPPGFEEDDPWRLAEIYYFPEVSADFIFPNGSKLYDEFPPPEPVPAGQGQILVISDTVYADGRTVPPDLLRDTPEQNYLSGWVRALGLSFFSVALATAVASAVWIFWKRNNRVVRAAQPHFLYLVCLGASVSVSAILTISFDESYGWDKEALGRACMATPWLSSLGHILTYGALFSKLWRVNKVLQFVRRKVDIAHVAWPSAILATLALVVLGLWTGLDKLIWERTIINPVTGESIGQCSSDNAVAFIVPLVLILLIPTLLTFYMAWKTKDVDDAYSESRWIFVMVLIQLEVLLFSAPMIPLLRDVSTDGRYIGYSLLIWTFPMSALCLIIVPKVVAVHGKNSCTSGRKRGETGQVKVSGLSGGSSDQRAGSSMEQRFSSSGELRQRYSHNTHSEGTHADPSVDAAAAPVGGVAVDSTAVAVSYPSMDPVPNDAPDPDPATCKEGDKVVDLAPDRLEDPVPGPTTNAPGV